MYQLIHQNYLIYIIGEKLGVDVILLDEPYWNLLYLMTKFNNVILSDSTIGIFATYLNKI